MKTKILLVDDEYDIVEFLQYNLEQEGFEVITAYDGKEAIEKITEHPDLIVLDVMMPNMDGYEVCSRIRATNGFKDTPIIFLTAKSSEIDEVKGLELGADDFIQKPVSPKKIIARVKSNLRKVVGQTGSTNNRIEIGPLKIDKEKYTVLVDGKSIIFPKKEFEILTYLAAQPGRVFPREKILNDLWGTDVFVVERTIDVHVRKIREKLDQHSDLIETIKGVGYRFKNY
jgi:two-component system alkaline phosphatase synthesis response regulator PhoP